MKILQYILVLCSLFFVLIPLNADTYWVAFTDKQGTTGTLDAPEDYLSERALQRREKQRIAIDSLDLPVSTIYRDSILRIGGKFIHQSRWHNGITIEVENTAIVEQIKACSFVRTVEQTQKAGIPLRRAKRNKVANKQAENEILSDVFTQMLGLDSLHNRGYRGKGMQIAVVDNGFYYVDELILFSQTNILETKDFVKPNNNVYLQGNHGTNVLCTMAGNVANHYEGAATEAGYYLLRTEDDDTESIREVDAMVAAFEYADSVGADIITSSLGYFYFDDATTDYTYAMHDGKTLRNSVAATIAARKGMLVCVSAGNEGNSEWHYISSPSDADSILTVGAVTADRVHSSFSSYGPTADGRIKPEVCAMGSGVPLYNSYGELTHANGTSFSCPIIAGMAACLWSACPEQTNMQLRGRIIRFASQYHAPDNTLGYGIPNVWDSYLDASTSVENVAANEIDWTNAFIYDLQGRYIGTAQENLQAGVYIQKKNGAVRKLQIK